MDISDPLATALESDSDDPGGSPPVTRGKTGQGNWRPPKTTYEPTNVGRPPTAAFRPPTWGQGPLLFQRILSSARIILGDGLRVAADLMPGSWVFATLAAWAGGVRNYEIGDSPYRGTIQIPREIRTVPTAPRSIPTDPFARRRTSLFWVLGVPNTIREHFISIILSGGLWRICQRRHSP